MEFFDLVDAGKISLRRSGARRGKILSSKYYESANCASAVNDDWCLGSRLCRAEFFAV